MPEILLTQGLIPFADGKICTGDSCCERCPCAGAVPAAWLLYLSTGDKLNVVREGTTGCVWRRTIESVDWTLTITDEYIRVTRVRTDGGDEYTSIWELSLGEQYVPLDCCEDLQYAVLPCASSDEDFCTDGVTVTIRGICDWTPGVCGCVPAAPDYLRVEFEWYPDSAFNGTYFLPRTETGSFFCVWHASIPDTTMSLSVQRSGLLSEWYAYVYLGGSPFVSGIIVPGPQGVGACLSWWGIATILHVTDPIGRMEVEAA